MMYITAMALHINNPGVEREIRELAAETGETITQTISIAVRELKLKRRSRKPNPQLAEELMRIARRIAAYPPKDNRTPEEVIGYDEIGLPR